MFLQVTNLLRSFSEKERCLPINYLDLVLLGNWAAESMASTEEQEHFRIMGHPALFLPCFTAEAASRACQTAKYIAQDCLPAKQRGNPINGILRAVGVRLQLLKHFSGSVTASERRCSQPAQELSWELELQAWPLGQDNWLPNHPRAFMLCQTKLLELLREQNREEPVKNFIKLPFLNPQQLWLL